MKCPKCGKRTPARLADCRHCGKRLPRQKEEETPPAGLLSPRQLLIVLLVGLSILAAMVIVILSQGEKRKEARLPDLRIYIEAGMDGREIASNAILGKVIAFRLRGNRRGTLAIRSLHTGKAYTFSIGWRTSYHPARYPVMGEQVKVYYLADKGLCEATQVVIGE
jgi:hypothetical protein